MLSRPEFESAGATAEPICSVSELNRRARKLLESGIGAVRVCGEISGFTRAASGHLYFSLKDADAQVRCALWRTKAGALAFEPKNGDAVDVRASVTLFEARGEYQLNIESMRRAGAGALFEQFLRLKEKLAAEGLFDIARKRPLPTLPRGVGIVTSPQAAALRDVLATLARRAPMINVVLYPTAVQGEGAAGAIAAAIALAGTRARQDGIDVLVVCRGGGSIEDLWSFNEEVVARAIASSPIPVVSGIGHETDFTIADWVADVRAPTPTAAAELVSPDVAEMNIRLAAVAAALVRSAAQRIAAAQQGLDWLTRALLPPSARLAWQRQRLVHSCRALQGSMQSALSAQQSRVVQARVQLRAPALERRWLQLEHARKRLVGAALGDMAGKMARLDRYANALVMLNPARVLERGFAIVSDAAGRVVRDGRGLAAGDALHIRFVEDEVRVLVDEVEKKPN